MPFPSPSRPLSGPPLESSYRPPRRKLLVGAVGVAAGTAATAATAGCSESAAERARQAEQSTAARKLRERSARDSRTLATRYEATAGVHPALTDRLEPLRTEVAAHADALAASSSSSPSSSGTPGASTSAPPPDDDKPPSAVFGRRAATDAQQVPSGEGEALAALADAERGLAETRTKALLDAPPELARLLASIAAAGAAHAYLLGVAEDG
ncbi:hypothetical protein AB0C51_22875 [Streptomyces pathocidini]|uniref:hypothetical protein n=1 Tax=Streptomyces pathocidini TaxID=1650571 RepID=UPI0033CAD993